MSRFLVTLATVMMLVAPCVAQNCRTINGVTVCDMPSSNGTVARTYSRPTWFGGTRTVTVNRPASTTRYAIDRDEYCSYSSYGSRTACPVHGGYSSHGGYATGTRSGYSSHGGYGGARFLHWGPATAADYERFGQEVPAELQSAPAAPADDEEEDADEPATKPKRLLGLKAPARVVAYRPGLRAPDRVAQYRPSAPATTVAMR